MTELLVGLAGIFMTGLLGLFGVGAGYRLRQSSSNDEQSLTGRLTSLSEAQGAIQQQLTEAVGTLDVLVSHELVALNRKVEAHERRLGRMSADLDATSDGLELLVTHIPPENLPPAARESLHAKLVQGRRWEVTGSR